MALDGSGAAVDDRLKWGRGVWALQRSERVEFHDGDLAKELSGRSSRGRQSAPCDSAGLLYGALRNRGAE